VVSCYFSMWQLPHPSLPPSLFFLTLHLRRLRLLPTPQIPGPDLPIARARDHPIAIRAVPNDFRDQRRATRGGRGEVDHHCRCLGLDQIEQTQFPLVSA
jgi:hypothetical protein